MTIEPTPLETEDLGGVFAKRTTGLSSSRRRRTTPPAPPAPGHVAASTPTEIDSSAPAQPEPALTGPHLEPAPQLGEPQAPTVKKSAHKNKHIYLPAVLSERMATYRDANKLTNAVVVMNAIDSCVDHDAADPLARLRALVEATLVSPARSTSLFDRTPQRIRDTSLGNAVQVTLRISDSQEDTFTQIQTQVAATDLGHLSAVALKEFFNPIDKDRT